MTDIDTLVERVRGSVGWNVDTDEVAAVLESGGVGDRAAHRDYGHASVFGLAGVVFAGVLAAGPRHAGPPVVDRRRLPIADTLIRAALYLTPTAVAVGASPRLGALPWLATTGVLVAGWATAHAMAYLGYCVANESGKRAAARPLATGFLLITALWLAVILVDGANTTAGLVCVAQLALFAANTAALVTGTERRTLAAASGCWLAVIGLLLGFVRPAWILLFASLVAMLAVAYRPALSRGSGRWLPGRRRYRVAVRHGLVGAGQAVLFALVVLHHVSAVSTPLAAAPLLLGVPLTELMLVWHRQRVAHGRALLADRHSFRRHLRRVSTGSGLALALPLTVGGLLTIPVVLRAVPDWSAVTETILLSGINALCLVLVAHRRPTSAGLLVWWPSLLIAAVTWVLPALAPTVAVAADRAAVATLLFAYPPALVLAITAMRDPWSYG